MGLVLHQTHRAITADTGHRRPVAADNRGIYREDSGQAKGIEGSSRSPPRGGPRPPPPERTGRDRRINASDLLPWIAERHKGRIVKRIRVRRPNETKAEYRAAPDRMQTRTFRGASGASINRDLALASAFFRWAIRARYLEENPIRHVERFSEKGRASETYLTAGEANALLADCSPVLRPIVPVALHTGLRRGEILSLAWRAVDLDRKEILVAAELEEAGRGRVVPMTPAAYATLKALRDARPSPALDGSDRVFTGSDGEPVLVGLLRVMFEPTVANCAGIPLSKRWALRFHDLRHTSASLMVAAGVPIFDVAKVLGHSTLAVTMRYAHFAPEAGRASVARLAAILDAAPTPNEGASTAATGSAG